MQLIQGALAVLTLPCLAKADGDGNPRGKISVRHAPSPVETPTIEGGTPTIEGYTFRGMGCCENSEGNVYGYAAGSGETVEECAVACAELHASDVMFVGINFHPNWRGSSNCNCMQDNRGNGKITSAGGWCSEELCYSYDEADHSSPDNDGDDDYRYNNGWWGDDLDVSQDHSGGFPLALEDDGFENGLYEVVDTDSRGGCVRFRLIYKHDNIGQIIGNSGRFLPIEIIGVDQNDNRIWGYFQDDTTGEWDRKRTKWGRALDGSLAGQVDGNIIGISMSDQMFSLWGDFSNFNYSTKSGFKCSSRPASIGDWSWGNSRGVYCPDIDDHQLRKYTWHGANNGGPTRLAVNWVRVSKLSRLGPESSIYGISTKGSLFTLWNDDGTMRSARIYNKAPITNVRAVGGLSDAYARGVFVSNGENRVYNVYWDGDWKAKEIALDYMDVEWKKIWLNDWISQSQYVYFGSRDGTTYVLYGAQYMCTDIWCFGPEGPIDEHHLYRLDFVGDTDRYAATLLRHWD